MDGDENSSFFHGLINANLKSNRINGLLIDGSWVSTPSVVKNEVYSFFSQKFFEPFVSRPDFTIPNIPTISDDDGQSLISPFTMTEVKKALWDCDGDRAPGLDGLNMNFLKKCWDEFKLDFMKMFEHLHRSGHINPCTFSSFISLIPKVEDPDSLSKFRPISLIGCINKVISKVLVNRLKSVISKVISEEQSAYLSERSILDGPLVLNEVISWLKQSHRSGMIFKLDINKAFDSVAWSFIDKMLHQMNFPPLWRS